MKQEKPISTRRKFLYSAVIFVIFIFALESLSYYFEKSMSPLTVDTDGGFSERSRAFLPAENGMMKLNLVKKLALHEQIFIKEKPNGVFRIALIGESSVYRLFPFQNELSQKLSKKLNRKVEILNFGANSYGSTRLLILANEIAEYSPDLVFLYVGNNEFEELEQFNLIAPNEAYLRNIVFQTATGRVATRFLLKNSIENLVQDKLETVDYERAWSHQFSKDEIKDRMDKFKLNLENMIALFQSKNIKVVMSTIPSNYLRPAIEPNSQHEIFKFYSAGQFNAAYELSSKTLSESGRRHQSSRLENAIIRKLAKDSHTYFFDFENTIRQREPNHIPGETLFDDHCHLNSKGNSYLIDELVSTINR